MFRKGHYRLLPALSLLAFVLVDCNGWLQICYDLPKVSLSASMIFYARSQYCVSWHKHSLTHVRYIWILPVIVYIALCAVGGNYFEIAPPAGTQSAANKGRLALSYLSLQIGTGLGWAAVSAAYISDPSFSRSVDLLTNRAVRLLSRVNLQLDGLSHDICRILLAPAFGGTVGAGFGAAL